MWNPTLFKHKPLDQFPPYWPIGLGLVLSLCLSIVLHQIITRQTLEIELWMSQSAVSPAHIYYAREGQEFRPEQVVNLRKTYATLEDELSFSGEIRSPRIPARLRFDLSQRTGEIILHGLKLRTQYGEVDFSAREIKSRAYGLNDGLWLHDDEKVIFSSTGTDPYFIVPVSSFDLDVKRSDAIADLVLSVAIYGGILFGLFLLLFASWNYNFRMDSRIGGFLDAIGKRMSDPPVLEFRRISVFVLFLLFSVFVLYSYLLLHNSSLWQWSAYYPLGLSEPSIFFGLPQAIRSDEWYGHTPWLLSQVQHGFPVHNASIGPKGSPLLIALPVEGPSMLFQPKFWGFAILDLEAGYSWYWATRLVSLLGSTYLLFLILLRGDERLAVIGTLWLFGSSYTQWWYAFSADIITSFALVAAGMLLMMRSAKIMTGVVGVLLFVVGALGFLFTLYPPHVVSLFYLVLILVFPSVVWMVRAQVEEARWGYRSILLGVGGGTVLTVTVPVLIAAWPAIEAISNTDYPGTRFALGGDYPLHLLGIGFFEFWRDETSTPSMFANPSEAAGFALFFPLAALVAFVKYRDTLARTQLIWAGIFAGFLVMWMAAPLPTFIRNLIAYAGWFAVPGARAYLALGIVSILATVLAVKLVKDSGPIGWRWTLLSASVVSFSIVFLWWRYRLVDPYFFSIERLLVAVLVAVSFVLAVSRGNRLVLAFGVFLLVLHPLQVNPIHTGLDPLLGNTVFKEMVIQDEQLEEVKWVVFGSGRAAQAMKANGMDVFGGIIYAPDRTLMSALDPGGEFRSVWNRYANVALLAGPSGSPTTFQLVHGDSYLIEIDPCNPTLLKMGFTHAVFEGDLSTLGVECFEEYHRDEVSGLAYGALAPEGLPDTR